MVSDALTSALASVQDGVHLDEGAARQAGDAHGGARRERLAHVLRHDLVDAREMGEIGQVYRHAHRVIEAQARGVGHRGEVAEHAVGLRFDALGALHGRGIEADLAGKIDRVARSDGLRIRADRRRRILALDRLLHGGYLSSRIFMPSIESLEKLIGTARDGALLRYSLGMEYAKAGDLGRAVAELREALAR